MINKGIAAVVSSHSFEGTFKQLQSNILSHGLTIFATINFSEDAERAGLKMNPVRLLIFGNPKAETPLMVALPNLAIDFPLKVLVSEDENGKVWLSYNSSLYLRERHNFPKSC